MTIDYDPADPQTNANPFPVFAALREDKPVYWSPSMKGWVVTRYEDARLVLRDAGRFSNARLEPYAAYVSRMQGQDVSALTDRLNQWAVFKDPPDHRRLRSLLNKAFIPYVAGLEPDILAIIDELIEAIGERTDFDLIEMFGVPLPVRVVARIFDLPREDLDDIKQWSDDLNEFSGGARLTPDKHARSTAAIIKLSDYFLKLVRQRRQDRGQDLISRLIEVVEQSPDEVSEDEIVQSCVLLVFAGHETTTDLIGNSFYHLLQNREQLRFLVDNPDAIGGAVDELLRIDSPAHCLVRVATEDVTLRSVEIGSGDRLFVMISSANHDEEAFAQPQRMDLCRKPNPIMSFGSGIHTCLGAPLVRLEGRLAIIRLIEAFPNMRLATTDVPWRDSYVVRGVRSLPVTRRSG